LYIISLGTSDIGTRIQQFNRAGNWSSIGRTRGTVVFLNLRRSLRNIRFNTKSKTFNLPGKQMEVNLNPK